MLKKIMLIGVLCISLAALPGTNANAYPTSLAGWFWGFGSITSTTTWIGLANTDVTPTNIVVTVFPENVTIYFENPAGNTGGVGVPFILDGTDISQFETIFPEGLTGRGKYTAEIEFLDEDIISAIPLWILDEYRPNPQWYPYKIDVFTFSAVVQAFTDVNSDDLEEEVGHYEFSCALQYDDDNNPFYSCTQDVDWEWSKKDPFYVPEN